MYSVSQTGIILGVAIRFHSIIVSRLTESSDVLSFLVLIVSLCSNVVWVHHWSVFFIVCPPEPQPHQPLTTTAL